MTARSVPNVTFHTRVRNDQLEGPNPYEWKDVTSEEIFAGRKVVVFGLPGAFTPACSESHLPGYEENHQAFRDLGIDEVICVSVNDAFVMFQWGKALGIKKVRLLPDGNGEFSEGIGMLVKRTAQGMGNRSWRYAMYVEDGQIEKVFSEPGFMDNPAGVPVQVSDAKTMLDYLNQM